MDTLIDLFEEYGWEYPECCTDADLSKEETEKLLNLDCSPQGT